MKTLMILAVSAFMCLAHGSNSAPESAMSEVAMEKQDWSCVLRGPLYRGWIPRTTVMDSVMVVGHSNPFPGVMVEARAPDGRVVLRVVKSVERPRLHGDAEFLFGDLAVCKLREPWPPDIKGALPATIPVRNQQHCWVWRKTNRPELAMLGVKPITGARVVWLREVSSVVGYGESGGPWFVLEHDQLRVVSMFTHGFGLPSGTDYSDMRVQQKLKSL